MQLINIKILKSYLQKLCLFYCNKYNKLNQKFGIVCESITLCTRSQTIKRWREANISYIKYHSPSCKLCRGLQWHFFERRPPYQNRCLSRREREEGVISSPWLRVENPGLRASPNDSSLPSSFVLRSSWARLPTCSLATPNSWPPEKHVACDISSSLLTVTK